VIGIDKSTRHTRVIGHFGEYLGPTGSRDLALRSLSLITPGWMSSLTIHAIRSGWALR
jgi:hypothetical protein